MFHVKCEVSIIDACDDDVCENLHKNACRFNWEIPLFSIKK